MERKKPHILPSPVIYGFFALGLLTAVAFRAIIVVQSVEPGWVRPLWYFAVGGNFLFFLYRYLITRRRKRAVEYYRLIEKLSANACLEDEDRQVMIYLLQSIHRSLENLNYLVIFIFSVIAIAADLLLAHWR